MPDTPENAEHFGCGSNGSASPNPYLQPRALALAEGRTRALLAAAHGPSSTGEQTLSIELLDALGPQMLVFADRNFASHTLWAATAATGADPVLADVGLLRPARTPRAARWHLPVRTQARPQSRRATDTGPGPGPGPGPRPGHRTACAPRTPKATRSPSSSRWPPPCSTRSPTRRIELAARHHDRWQAETGIADLKTSQRGGQETVLRSQSPTMVWFPPNRGGFPYAAASRLGAAVLSKHDPTLPIDWRILSWRHNFVNAFAV